MFTGIVTGVGEILKASPLDAHNEQAGLRLRIQANNFSLDGVRLGDSIAIQGACMTVVELSSDSFSVDVSRESLNRTAGLNRPGRVNLERSLKLGDSLDGHLVSGHVDGLGTVMRFAPVGESWDLHIDVPENLAKFMAYKGSVVVNGVSLTVNQVDDHGHGCRIRINLIPHTVQETTLGELSLTDSVNLEVDMIARYCERLLSYRNTD